MLRKIAICATACFALAAGRASATTIDLTTAGASGTGSNELAGATDTYFVQQVPDQSTGTGVIAPFVRIQDTGNEMGYNTSLAPEYDEKTGTWTHALLLADVPLVTLADGFQYRQFLLDINQNTGGDNEFLTLNQIQIFLANADTNSSNLLNDPASGGQALIGFAAPITEIFRMNNADGTNAIQMNYALNSGSGSGDMYLYVRNSDFLAGFTNVILFSQFGNPPVGSSGSNDGFEEWAVVGQGGGGGGGESPVPEPASLVLLGTGLGFVARRFRRGKKA